MDAKAPEVHDVHIPFKTVFASIVGLWICYFVLTTLRSELLQFGFTIDLLGYRALASVAGIAITLALWLALRLSDKWPLWAKIAAALILSMLAAVSIVKSNEIIFADMQRKVGQRIEAQQRIQPSVASDGDLWSGDPLSRDGNPQASPEVIVRPFDPSQSFIEQVFGRYFMMLAWCALYLALLTGEKARAAERREGAYRRAAKAAELRSLRYQVNPHFLFNTLNSLSALVLTGKTQAAEKVIQTLSTFYRRSLADDPTADVPLREEFALQRLYLDIEAIRFPRRLRAKYELPDELEDVRVPGMILQPLVENSVKHAVAPSSGTVTITLAAREEYGRLVLTVSDDGPGDGSGAREGYGIGLVNVRDRLAARFGDAATIVSGPVPGGYSTQLRLPILREAEEDA